MIIDHVGLSVSNYEQSKRFYLYSLAPLGISLIAEHNGWSGLGKNDQPEFWFGPGDVPFCFMQVAFAAETKELVDAFYDCAMEAGALCKGPPKLRTDYYSNYYGAFITDYDGHCIGVVVHHSKGNL